MTSANITVDNSEDEASNVVDGKKGGKQSGAQDGDDDDAEQVLPEKLNFLLQQSSIYSKIIAGKSGMPIVCRDRLADCLYVTQRSLLVILLNVRRRTRALRLKEQIKLNEIKTVRKKLVAIRDRGKL